VVVDAVVVEDGAEEVVAAAGDDVSNF